jgi:hypothetical protein
MWRQILDPRLQGRRKISNGWQALSPKIQASTDMANNFRQLDVMDEYLALRSKVGRKIIEGRIFDIAIFKLDDIWATLAQREDSFASLVVLDSIGRSLKCIYKQSPKNPSPQSVIFGPAQL